MWPEIINNLQGFSSAVLTGTDPDGYPYSLRCHPIPDLSRQILRVALPNSIPLQAGPACLLCHRHDQRLWNLKSFVVRGNLARDLEGWYLAPQRFIPGMGIGGVASYGRFLIQGRRTTRKYLAQRGLARPRVDWNMLAAMMRDAGEAAIQ